MAAILNLGFPGGPVVDRRAQRGDPDAVRFPRTLLAPDSLDFSFSGLKTAVLYAARGPNSNRNAPLREDVNPADLAASFQAAVVDVLVDRLGECAAAVDARGLVVCGGVAANSALRTRADALAVVPDGAAVGAGDPVDVILL